MSERRKVTRLSFSGTTKPISEGSRDDSETSQSHVLLQVSAALSGYFDHSQGREVAGRCDKEEG